jgi:hypothetical protein
MPIQKGTDLKASLYRTKFRRKIYVYGVGLKICKFAVEPATNLLLLIFFCRIQTSGQGFQSVLRCRCLRNLRLDTSLKSIKVPETKKTYLKLSLLKPESGDNSDAC